MRLISQKLMRPLAAGLCWLMAAMASAQVIPTKLDIVVLRGEGASNSIRRRAASEPLVRVVDEEQRPVAGAVVVFTLPTEGATGGFNGEKSLIVTTDTTGEAAARPLKLNAVPGKAPIHVSASYRGLTARTVINQVSVVPPGEKPGSSDERSHRGLIAVLIAVGAAAGGGAAYAVTQQKNPSSPASPSTPPSGPTPIGITPGIGTIAGGR